MVYNKLVRDKIPQIIRRQGQKTVTRKLEGEEYTLALERKLDEEGGFRDRVFLISKEG